MGRTLLLLTIAIKVSFPGSGLAAGIDELNFLVGTWTVSGEILPLGEDPGYSVTGSAEVQTAVGEHVLQITSTVSGKAGSESVLEVIAANPDTDTLLWNRFDERGGQTLFEGRRASDGPTFRLESRPGLSVTGNTWRTLIYKVSESEVRFVMEEDTGGAFVRRSFQKWERQP